MEASDWSLHNNESKNNWLTFIWAVIINLNVQKIIKLAIRQDQNVSIITFDRSAITWKNIIQWNANRKAFQVSLNKVQCYLSSPSLLVSNSYNDDCNFEKVHHRLN
ncbi:hypothetical protein V1478_009779 [Vespula squamosa]|uniref:Uncharacterized protein n=1 Tax=Vespula squamosa TaxID=30214 RepID=A0ABD2AJE2_VESSQ